MHALQLTDDNLRVVDTEEGATPVENELHMASLNCIYQETLTENNAFDQFPKNNDFFQQCARIFGTHSLDRLKTYKQYKVQKRQQQQNYIKQEEGEDINDDNNNKSHLTLHEALDMNASLFPHSRIAYVPVLLSKNKKC